MKSVRGISTFQRCIPLWLRGSIIYWTSSVSTLNLGVWVWMSGVWYAEEKWIFYMSYLSFLVSSKSFGNNSLTDHPLSHCGNGVFENWLNPSVYHYLQTLRYNWTPPFSDWNGLLQSLPEDGLYARVGKCFSSLVCPVKTQHYSVSNKPSTVHKTPHLLQNSTRHLWLQSLSWPPSTMNPDPRPQNIHFDSSSWNRTWTTLH